MVHDVSRSVEQLCTQMSMSNVTIPVFSHYKEAYDFIGDFELATTGISEEQKLILLAKAFPPGRHRSWFEIEIKPVIDRQGKWSEARIKILDRFTFTDDKDKHFAKLKELKFEESGEQSLLEFIDDMSYSYKKAFPAQLIEDDLVRYIKASLPGNIKSALNIYADFRSAGTLESMKKAAKQYEASRKSSVTSKTNDRATLTKFSALVQELIKGVRKDHETTREAEVSALRFQSERNNTRRVALGSQMGDHRKEWQIEAGPPARDGEISKDTVIDYPKGPTHR